MVSKRKTTKAKKAGTTASRARKTGKGSRSGKAATRVFNFNDFFLHPWNDQMKDKEIDDYNFVTFDKPRTLRSPNSAAPGIGVPVKSSDDDTLLGYVPLPSRYISHWKQLCYTIVYHKAMHAALCTLSRSKRPKYPEARNCARSVSAILKYNLYARGKIIEEIFTKRGSKFDTLPTFDEYIIKERWDLHWVELSELGKFTGAEYLGRSPFDEDVADALSK